MCVSSIAPHEICKDEYQELTTWKRASAGETVYNKCPSNATGKSSKIIRLFQRISIYQ